MKKLGADAILITMLLSWMGWISISTISLGNASAIRQTQYENIMEVLREIKDKINKTNQE